MTGGVTVWRHPRLAGAGGLCLGAGTDWPVDPRRAKRLAHRIRAHARRHGLPRIVVTSPLERAAAVGRWLERWGWRHELDPALAELHFGAWDGRPWQAISKGEVDAWCAAFAQARPGGHGETVAELLARVRAWRPGQARLAVAHGGWMAAALWLGSAGPCHAPPAARDWPAAPAHGQHVTWRAPPLG